MTPRPPAPSTTRERLIAEAIALFARKGFEATRTAEIEQAAGLAPGSGGAFRYFESKRRLLADGVFETVNRARTFVSAVEAGVVDLDRAIDAGEIGDIKAAYRRLGSELLDRIDEIADACIVILREAGVSRDEVPELDELADRFALTNYEAAVVVFGEFLAGRGVDIARFDLPVYVYQAFAPLFHARVLRWLLGSPPGGIDDVRLLDAWAFTQASLLRQLLDNRPGAGV